MRNAQRYYDLSLQAEAQRNWAGAYEGYRRALINYRSAGAPVAYISAATYNMGRMAGYTCKYKEAEQLLIESVSLEEQSSRPDPGNLTKRWSELARLYEAQEKFGEAAAYYSRAVPELERLGAPRSDPIGFADYLNAYAAALQASGKPGAALQTAQRATDLRTSSPTSIARFVPVTYKSICGAGAQ
jgi:tetratricopeptide (TPR) repeat protein